MNLKPLHHLYQTISPACLLDDEEPLVAVSRLERRGKAPSGEIEWVVGVAAQGGQDAPVWWSTRLGAHGIEQLANQASVADSLLDGTAITRDALADCIRTRWIEGHLQIRNFEDSQRATERQPIQLVVVLAGNVPLSIELSPCDDPPLPVLSILAHVIPLYNKAGHAETAVRSLEPRLALAQQERDKLAIENGFLREEVKELKKSWRDAAASGQTTKRARSEEGPSRSSQPGGTSQPSQRAKSGSLSPQKKGRPGIDYKAVMRPGTKGYAGSANRVGRDLGDEWEEPDSDSD
ncbi:hypothetical protein JCM11491_007203 [Sporobolomyces phaffii]